VRGEAVLAAVAVWTGRLNGAEQQDADPEQQQEAWERFTTGGAPDAPPS
jgi:hypothetical protein